MKVRPQSAVAALIVAASTGILGGALGDTTTSSRASAILQTFAASSGSSVFATPLREARRAIDRAIELRRAGDSTRAALADDLALEWADTARTLRDALAIEESADRLAREGLEATQRAARSSTLLEEAVARRGRVKALLNASSAPSSERPLVPTLSPVASAATRPSALPTAPSTSPASGDAP